MEVKHTMYLRYLASFVTDEYLRNIRVEPKDEGQCWLGYISSPYPCLFGGKPWLLGGTSTMMKIIYFYST